MLHAIVHVLLVYLLTTRVNGASSTTFSFTNITFKSSGPSVWDYLNATQAVLSLQFEAVTNNSALPSTPSTLTLTPISPVKFPDTSVQAENPTDFVVITATFVARALVNGNYNDTASVLYQTPISYNTSGSINVQFSRFNWSLSLNYVRQCPTGYFGFSCTNVCSEKQTNDQCYHCSTEGQKICCDLPNIDPVTCYNRTSPMETTTYVNTHFVPNKNNESLYKWIMIGLAIALLIVLIIAVVCLIIFCIRRAPQKEVFPHNGTPVYNVPKPKLHSHKSTARRPPPQYPGNRGRVNTNSTEPRADLYSVPYRPTPTEANRRIQVDDNVSSDWSDIQQPRREAQV